MLYNRRGVSDYVLYDEAGIFDRTGVTPAQYPEYAALRGDPSDNLPGVPGVGEKTAAKLISTYGGLDGMFTHLDELTPKLRASLAEHEQRVRKNHEVTVLRRDAPIDIPGELVMQPDPAEVKRLFDFLEFRTLRGAPRRGARRRRRIVPSTEERQPLVAEVIVSDRRRPQSAAVLDALDVASPRRVVRGRAGRGRRSTGSPSSPTRPRPRCCGSPAITSTTPAVAAGRPDVRFRAHDAKPLMRSLLDRGIELTGLELDTAIAAYLLEAGRGALRAGRTCSRLHAVRGAGRRPRQRRASSTSAAPGSATIERAGRERARRPGRSSEPIVAAAGTHGDARPLPDHREPAGGRAGADGARRHRRRPAGAAGAQRPPHR